MEHASDRALRVRVPYTSRLYAYTRMERRDRFIPLRSTCTVKMQSRLARQRIHQHTRAHTRQPRGVPLPRNLDAEGVVYPRTVTSLSTCPDIIDKSQFSRLRRDSTFRFSSSFIIHPFLRFIPSFLLFSYSIERLRVFLERPIRRCTSLCV